MKNSMAGLKERLSDWKGWDMVSYDVGACLGFWGDFGAPPGHDCWKSYKWVMWSDNPLGNILSDFVHNLVKIGMLEKRDEPDVQYRWNSSYKELD